MLTLCYRHETRRSFSWSKKALHAQPQRGQAAIRAGLVKVDGEVLEKPSESVGDGATIEYATPHPFVSRGGVKLAAALDHFRAVAETGLLDIGASRRLHRSAAAGRRGAGSIALSMSAMARCIHDVSRDSAMSCSRTASMPAISRRRSLPSSPRPIIADVSFIGLNWRCRRLWRWPHRARGWWRWSSRNSKWAGCGWARAALSAIRMQADGNAPEHDREFIAGQSRWSGDSAISKARFTRRRRAIERIL